MSTYRLDVPELHRRLDTRRRELGLTWRDVAQQTRLAPATFTRITHGHSLEADALVSLLVWLDLGTGIAALIEPGDERLPCPGCGRDFQPKRDGSMRAHPCRKAAERPQLATPWTPNATGCASNSTRRTTATTPTSHSHTPALLAHRPT